ncbi:MAG: hypothetical protein ACYCVN_11225 [Acidimicrobiales bacterium]
MTQWSFRLREVRPRKRRWADGGELDYEELVAAAAQVHSPEAALSAPSAPGRSAGRQVNCAHGPARDTDFLAEALEDDQAAMALRRVFEHTGIPWRERWAEAHLELVVATHR